MLDISSDNRGKASSHGATGAYLFYHHVTDFQKITLWLLRPFMVDTVWL